MKKSLRSLLIPSSKKKSHISKFSGRREKTHLFLSFPEVVLEKI